MIRISVEEFKLKNEDEDDNDLSDPTSEVDESSPDNILAKKFQLRDEGLIIIKEYLSIWQGKRGSVYA